MKRSKNPIVLAFAAIGVCVVLYAVWHLYRQAEVKEQSRAAFTAPAPSGIPDILHSPPGASPIQPH